MWITPTRSRKRKSIGRSKRIIRRQHAHWRRTILMDPTGESVDEHERPLAHRLLHIAGVYLSVLAGFVISLLLVVVLPGGGSHDRFFGQVISEPFWVPEIIAGILVGRLFYSRAPSRVAFVAWLVPCILLAWNVWSDQQTMSAYDSTWDTFFGRNCGGSECLYQLVLTVPFYAGVAYSLGACVAFFESGKKT
jgi:hypothetical protein